MEHGKQVNCQLVRRCPFPSISGRHSGANLEAIFRLFFKMVVNLQWCALKLVSVLMTVTSLFTMFPCDDDFCFVFNHVTFVGGCHKNWIWEHSADFQVYYSHPFSPELKAVEHLKDTFPKATSIYNKLVMDNAGTFSERYTHTSGRHHAYSTLRVRHYSSEERSYLSNANSISRDQKKV